MTSVALEILVANGRVGLRAGLRASYINQHFLNSL